MNESWFVKPFTKKNPLSEIGNTLAKKNPNWFRVCDVGEPFQAAVPQSTRPHDGSAAIWKAHEEEVSLNLWEGNWKSVVTVGISFNPVSICSTMKQAALQRGRRYFYPGVILTLLRSNLFIFICCCFFVFFFSSRTWIKASWANSLLLMSVKLGGRKKKNPVQTDDKNGVKGKKSLLIRN